METSKIQLWNRTTEAIYKNVMLFAIAGMASALFSFIPLLGWIVNIANVCVASGYIAFFIRLKDMQDLVEPSDVPSAKYLCNGVLLHILSIMLRFVPAVGWILGPLAVIVSCVFMLMGYNGLKKSETFVGKEGMKMLFIAMIIGIAGGVFSIIPVIGTILAGICFIVEFVMVLLGWKKVAETVAE